MDAFKGAQRKEVKLFGRWTLWNEIITRDEVSDVDIKPGTPIFIVFSKEDEQK